MNNKSESAFDFMEYRAKSRRKDLDGARKLLSLSGTTLDEIQSLDPSQWGLLLAWIAELGREPEEKEFAIRYAESERTPLGMKMPQSTPEWYFWFGIRSALLYSAGEIARRVADRGLTQEQLKARELKASIERAQRDLSALVRK